MLLSDAKVNYEGYVKDILGDEKNKQFLMSLGCFKGAKIKLISILAGTYVINIKDSRYALDHKMASSIKLQD